MTMTQQDIARGRRRRISWWLPHGPTGAFAVAAAFGAGLLIMLAGSLPGTRPDTVVIAVAFFVLGAGVAGRFLQRDFPYESLGSGNVVTLARFVLVASLIAPVLSGAGAAWAVFVIAAVALSLDGLDGWLARTQGHVSDFGARFDMEVDSALALILAANLAIGTELGMAALLLGLPRYAFAASGFALPWMARALPARFSRKVVCVLQMITLVALQAPVFPAAIAAPLVCVAIGSLVWSFAVDVAWLWQRRG